MSADDGSRIQARVSRVPVFQPRRLWYLLSDIDRRAIGTFPLPERSLESFRCASGFFNVTTSLPSAVLSSFIAISIPSFRVSSSAPFRYYGPNLVPLRRLVDPPLQLGEQHRHLLRPHRHHDLRSVAIERAEGGGLPILPFCTVMAERLILGSTYRSYPTYTFTMGE